ncbi:MAG: sporulation integral membrane protein YtvI [Desulfitobacteriaceae bacterium]
MRINSRHPFWSNLNRLAIILSVLVSLKLFTYFVQDFLPIFGEVIRSLFMAFLPFVLALLLAFLLEPFVVRTMEILRVRRTYAALLSLFSTLGILGLLAFMLIARLYTELSDLAISLPDYAHMMDYVTTRINTIEKFLLLNPQVQVTLFSSAESILKSVQEWAKTGSLFLLNFLTALPGVFIVFVISIVATLMVSSIFPRVKHFANSLMPRRWHENAQAVSQDLGVAIVGFLRAQVILVSVTALTSILGLALIGNRYAVTLGVLTGVLDLVPIVGTGVLYVPWIIGVFVFGSVSEGVKLSVMWLVLVVLRQFLEPKIMSKNIGLHPLPTLISMYVGLQLLGGAGLILGPTLVIFYEALRKSGFMDRPRT